MTGLSISEINSFAGGMNNVTAPYLIAKDESTLLINSDIRRGAMWSIPRPLFYEVVTDEYFFQFKDDVYTYENWRSNVIWDNTYYWSDGIITGKTYADGTTAVLGLPTPTVTPTAVVDGVIEEGPLDGDLKYCYTFYNNETGVESAPSTLSVYAKPEEQDVVVDNFEPLPTDATHYRVYRIGGYLPYFMLVEMLEPTDLPYTDALDDTEIDGRQLQTIRNGPPPEGIKYFTELNGRMYGAVGNTVYFSALGNPDSWYIYDVIPCKDTITGIAKSPGGLIICGYSFCNLLQGNDPGNFNLISISDSIGMINITSLAYIDKTAIWLSRHGIVMSDGYTIKQLTADKIEDISAMDPVGAVTINNIYYMVFRPSLFPANDLFPSDKLFPASIQGTGGLGSGILVMDFKRGNGYAYELFDFDNVKSIGLLNGQVGIISGTAESHATECYTTPFPDCDDNLRCGGYELAYLTKYTTDLSDIPSLWSELTYISPLLVDGSTSTLKQYDKIRIVFKGEFNIQILFDNDRVVQSAHIVEDETDPGFDEIIIGIPNDDNLSTSIRYVIVGKGVITGIQHSYKNRELP